MNIRRNNGQVWLETASGDVLLRGKKPRAYEIDRPPEVKAGADGHTLNESSDDWLRADAKRLAGEGRRRAANFRLAIIQRRAGSTGS